MKKKILFVADWPKTTDNVRELQKLLNRDYSDNYEWKVWSCKDEEDNKVLYRWYCYLKGALYVIRNRKKYHAVLIWQQMVGYILFEILNITGIKIKNIVFYTFIYHTKNFFRHFKKHMVRSALKHSNGLLWPSSEMANQVKKDFIEYAYKNHTIINPILDIIDPNLEVAKELDDPRFRNGVYTAGKSARDFNIVIRAFRNTDIPVTIVCPDDYPITEANITQNIRILRFSQVSHQQYYALARQAFCLLISTDNDKSTYGLLMVNFAMENAKPIIATDSEGVKDYIIHNETGMLFKLGQADEIRNAYEKLVHDEDLREKIIKNGKAAAKKMSPGYFIEKIINVVESNQSVNKELLDVVV